MSTPSDDPAQFHIDLRRHDGRAELVLHGDLVDATAESFDDQVRRLASQYDGTQVTIDLTDIDAIDAAGTESLKRAARLWQWTGPVTLSGRAPMLDALVADLGRFHLFDITLSE